MGSGTLAVYMFFVISGFLITQSMVNSKSYMDYIVKRFLRIMPALFCCLVLSAFIISPIVSKLSFSDYLNHEVNPSSYFVKNLVFGIFGFYYVIADVFSTNPFPSSINASLWTLPNELACYTLVVILSVFAFFKNRRGLLLFYFISLLLVYWNMQFGSIPIPDKNDHWWMLGVNYIGGFMKLSCYFIAGSVLYCYRDKITSHIGIFVVLAVILVIAANLKCLDYALLICLPYMTISICFLKPVVNLRKIGDFSYGIYIYAFPIQQFFAFYLSDKMTFIPFLAITTLCVVGVSAISWHFVEKPALSLKKKYKSVRQLFINDKVDQKQHQTI